MKLLTMFIVMLMGVRCFAEVQTFSSGASQVNLIELYTSEGCSSCPPAERRMNSYASNNGLWKEFVPLAFHVDYWNYLGWKDRFSKPEFTARQRKYSKQWKSRTIYTPCFVINGKTTRYPQSKQSKKKPGTLSVKIDGNTASVTFSSAKKKSGKLQVWLAPLSGEKTSKVKAGENRGKTLHHQFIALDLLTQVAESDGSDYSATFSTDFDESTAALAVWVSSAKLMSPIQATGGWLK